MKKKNGEKNGRRKGDPTKENMRPQDAAAFLSVSPSYLYTLETTDPDFPKKVIIGRGVKIYRRKDLQRYVDLKAGDAA